MSAILRPDRAGLRVELAADLIDGAPLAYGVTAANADSAPANIRRFEETLESGGAPTATLPSRAAVAHMHSLLALDAEQAGLSHRQIAILFFGLAAVTDRWDENGETRAAVRDALKRGRRYRDGHWRSLVWPPRRGGDERPV